MKRYRSAFVYLLILVFCAAPAMWAQETQEAPAARPGRGYDDVPRPMVPCPHPFTRTLKAPPPSTPNITTKDFTGTLATAVAGSVWNQTNVNHGFGHSFLIPSPGSGKECCLTTKARLRVFVKALQAGGTGSSTSANDWVQIVVNGASVPGFAQQPFASGATVGQTATVTFNNIPQSILSTGVVSFYVQDDTAVTGAELDIQGCCLQ